MRAGSTQPEGGTQVSRGNPDPAALSPLVLLCICAFVLRFSLALWLPNMHAPDEIFQSIEQAHRVVFGTGLIPWEFQAGARSWLLPGFLTGILKLAGPTAYLAAVSAVLCLLSLAPVVVGYLWGQRLGGRPTGLLIGAACAVWFELVYFAPKALSEVIAGHLLLVGMYMAWPGNEEASRRRLVWAGMVLGLALALRVQLAPATGVVGLYVCRTAWREKWAPFIAGAMLVVCAAGLLDWVTWSSPFHSYLLYFQFHGVLGETNILRRAWTFYFIRLLRTWSIGVVPILYFVYRSVRTMPMVAGVAAAVILTHTFVPQKLYRYIYPAIPLIVIQAGLGSAQVAGLVSNFAQSSKRRRLFLWIAGWCLCSGLLAVGPDFRRNWTRNQGIIQAMRELRASDDACGVGLWRITWADSEGYTYLHRDLPLYLLNNEADFTRLKGGLNYLLARSDRPPPSGEFTRWKCWAHGGDMGQPVCLYRRPGACSSENIAERLRLAPDEASENLLMELKRRQ